MPNQRTRNPKRGLSRERGVAPKCGWANSPVSAPPSHTKGMPRRLMAVRRVGHRVDADEATAWAATRDWWPLVTNKVRPYCDSRNYIWILREEPKTP